MEDNVANVVMRNEREVQSEIMSFLVGCFPKTITIIKLLQSGTRSPKNTLLTVR